MARTATGSADVVHLFVKNTAELNRLAPRALKALKHNAVFWISYPKRSAGVETDINRDHGWDVIQQAGVVGVAQVSIDNVWSALRFRLSELAARKKGA